MKVILASSSPRRLALLNMIGISPVVYEPRIEEKRWPDEPVDFYVERITKLKGSNINNVKHKDNLVISSDTVVQIHDQILGKPADRQEAMKFLQLLSGNWHQVVSGLFFRYQEQSEFALAKTRVLFSALTADEIEFYLDLESYSDKAGAYGIQSIASLFVEKIEGCYFNVVGLPINLFYRMLKNLGLDINELRS